MMCVLMRMLPASMAMFMRVRMFVFVLVREMHIELRSSNRSAFLS